MALARFTGVVRGYQIDDRGDIRLTVDDGSPSEVAKLYVREQARTFDPKSSAHGFGAKDKECPYKPGFAPFVFTVSEFDAKDITIGSVVDVTIDVWHFRRVVFGKKNWFPMSDLRYDPVSIKVASVSAPQSSAGVGGSSGSGGKSGK